MLEPGEPSLQADYQQINDCFSAASVESIIEQLTSLQKDWANDVLQTLAQKAPLSLKVTLEQLRRAKSRSMIECIRMDFCLVNHFMRDHDFYEGVRALLVDKDKSPKWQPDSLEQVTQAKVDSYFQ
jgi:enoyl-CoA hydratase/carnithine racemase